MLKAHQTRADYAENDAIVDDLAGQAYVEQFGQETFQRADNAMKANKASRYDTLYFIRVAKLMRLGRQTADTFQAAATFLELCQIWGPLDAEVASKIKFAKYHALRIAKAIKAGEDPNLSNPAPEPSPGVEQMPLNANDLDIEMSDDPRTAARQPSIQEVPDEQDQIQPHLAQRSTYDESLRPSRAPSFPPQASHHQPLSPPETTEDYYHNTEPVDVSPLAPSSADRRASEGGGYFPSVPGPSTTGSLPDAPSIPASSTHIATLPDVSPLPPPHSISPNLSQPSAPPANSLHSFPPPNMDEPPLSPPPAPHPIQPPVFQREDPPPNPRAGSSYPPNPPTFHTAVPRAAHPSPATMASAQSRRANSRPTAPVSVTEQDDLRSDEESVLKAQRHAKFAMSALNFEDVTTAVKELRAALEVLGAR